MTDEFKKVSARIPVPLLEKLEEMGISNQTEAIIKGLERLTAEDSEKTKEDSEKTVVLQAKVEELQKQNESLKNELENIREDNEKTREDSEKTAVLQVKVEEIQAHNETLKKEHEDFKAMHNNYMLQMQTLIQQKAIEAPGAKKPWWRFW